jgi:hypothetical protein
MEKCEKSRMISITFCRLGESFNQPAEEFNLCLISHVLTMAGQRLLVAPRPQVALRTIHIVAGIAS